MMQKFQQKPVTIAAVQWDGTAEGATPIVDWILENGGTATYHCDVTGDELVGWLFDSSEADELVKNGSHLGACTPETPHVLRIQTLEGPLNSGPGWWIIKGIKGEFYGVQPDVFLASYNLELSIEGCTGTVPCECEACKFAEKNREFDGALYEGFNIVYSGGPSNEVVRG